MNFFSSIPSTCYIYLAYYPTEEKEHRFTSTQKKKAENKRKKEKRKEKKRKEKKKQEIYFHVPMDAVWFSLTLVSHFLYAYMQVSLSTSLLRRTRTNSNTILNV